MTRKDHALRIAQARSIITKRLHLAKATARDTGQAQGLLHPITTINKIDETARTYLMIQQRDFPEDSKQTPFLDPVQRMSTALMLYRLSIPAPSLAYDPTMALNFGKTSFTDKLVSPNDFV